MSSPPGDRQRERAGRATPSGSARSREDSRYSHWIHCSIISQQQEHIGCWQIALFTSNISQIFNLGARDMEIVTMCRHGVAIGRGVPLTP